MDFGAPCSMKEGCAGQIGNGAPANPTLSIHACNKRPDILGNIIWRPGSRARESAIPSQAGGRRCWRGGERAGGRAVVCVASSRARDGGLWRLSHWSIGWPPTRQEYQLWPRIRPRSNTNPTCPLVPVSSISSNRPTRPGNYLCGLGSNGIGIYGHHLGLSPSTCRVDLPPTFLAPPGQGLYYLEP